MKDQSIDLFWVKNANGLGIMGKNVDWMYFFTQKNFNLTEVIFMTLFHVNDRLVDKKMNL